MDSNRFLGNLLLYHGFNIVSYIMGCLRSLFHPYQLLLNDYCRFDPTSHSLCTQKRNPTFVYNYLTISIVMQVADLIYFHSDYQLFGFHELL